MRPARRKLILPERVEAVVAQPVVARGAGRRRARLWVVRVGAGRGASVELAVGSVVVVDGRGSGRAGLGGRRGSRRAAAGSSQLLEGLVEALDLALGLRVAGVAVLLGDAEDRRGGTRRRSSRRRSGRCRRGRCRSAWRRGSRVRRLAARNVVDDDVAGDRGVGGAAEQVAGVVVEPVEDLDVGAVGQAPVGEVGLPALVGLGGSKRR